MPGTVQNWITTTQLLPIGACNLIRDTRWDKHRWQALARVWHIVHLTERDKKESALYWVKKITPYPLCVFQSGFRKIILIWVNADINEVLSRNDNIRGTLHNLSPSLGTSRAQASMPCKAGIICLGGVASKSNKGQGLPYVVSHQGGREGQLRNRMMKRG